MRNISTTVYLTEPTDFGAGKHRTITFDQCGWHVDDNGTLYLRRLDGRGNVAAFAREAWDVVIDDRGQIASRGEK